MIDAEPRMILRHLRLGWAMIASFILLGLALETLHGFKIQWYLAMANETRRLLWTLAHAHGVLLGLLNVAYALSLRNFAVRGSDYSLAMLKEDLLGGLGGSLGSAAVGKMLGPVAKGLAERLGPKCSPEILAFAKTVGHETMGLATTAGNIEGAALIQGQEGDLALYLR